MQRTNQSRVPSSRACEWERSRRSVGTGISSYGRTAAPCWRLLVARPNASSWAVNLHLCVAHCGDFNLRNRCASSDDSQIIARSQIRSHIKKTAPAKRVKSWGGIVGSMTLSEGAAGTTTEQVHKETVPSRATWNRLCRNKMRRRFGNLDLDAACSVRERLCVPKADADSAQQEKFRLSPGSYCDLRVCTREAGCEAACLVQRKRVSQPE